ncbi:MAG: HIT family protein [Microcella sp.]
MFCEIVAGREPSEVVAEDEKALAFMDIDPGADGHLLVIPKAHSVDLLSIPPADLVAATLMAQRIAQVSYGALDAEGVTLLNCCGTVGWQTVFHFHLHVIPRHSDRARDRLELPYPPNQSSDRESRAGFARALATALNATNSAQ